MDNWWKDYFLDAWTHIQHATKGEEDTFLESNYVEEMLREKGYQTVLDVPCGYGRISIELAQQGFQTCGIDFNKRNIEIAQKVSKDKGLTQKTEWVCGDMRVIPPSYRGRLSNDFFDAAICIFGSFGYFDDADNREFLQSVYDALKIGGSFLIDTHTLETLLPIFSPQEFWRFENCWVLEERTFNVEKSRIESNWWTIQDEGRQLEHQSSVRIYGYRELIAILQSIGFKNFRAEGSFEGDAYELGAERLLLLAEK